MTAEATNEKAARGGARAGAGRPRADGGTGQIRRVNLTLDEESLALAGAIHPQISVAVRMALAYWSEQHPPGAK